MKKLIAILLAMLMVITIFAGCAETTTDESSSTDKESSVPAKDDEKEEESDTEEPSAEVADITIFIAENGNVDYPYSFESPAQAKIHELALNEYGLNLSYETAISTEFETILNTRFASGENLPDVVSHRYDDIKLNEVYNNGVIISIDDYEHPNFDEFLEEVPYLRIANGSADGKLLRFCEVFFNVSHITNGLNVRKDWLTELGMELPTTTEELREAVQAFQDNDMNGDGAPNEQLAFTDWKTMNYVLATAFGVQKMTDAKNSWCYTDDGKVYNSMVTDEAKAYCEYIASLYSQGLIWENFLNYTNDDYSAFKLANRYAGSCGRNWDGVLLPTEMNGYGLTCENTPIIPITDGTREPASVITNYAGSGGIMFTRDCDAPDRCVAFWDYFYTVEGHQLRYYGEVAPGGDYYVKDDSAHTALGLEPEVRNMIPTDKYNEESATMPDLRSSLGINQPMFPSASISGPGIVVAEYYLTFTPEICGDSARLEYMVPIYEWHLENGTYELSMIAANEEQAKVISDHADLFAYMDEQIKAFQSCVRDMSEWDDFVATCESMGLAEVTAVQQVRYDGYLAAMGE